MATVSGSAETRSAKNIVTVLIGRFIQGAAGSIGATLVGGTISDIYIPSERGLPMALFAFMAMLGTGLGPAIFSWVEANPRLQWRWIQWIQLSESQILYRILDFSADVRKGHC